MTRYERLEELGEGVEGPRRWLPFQPDESIRPRVHLGVEDRRLVCAPPKGYRRDADGALRLTPWRPPPLTAARKAEVAKHRLPDVIEEEIVPGTPTPASDKRPMKNRQPTPKPPDDNPFGKAVKPSTPKAGFGANLTAAEKRAQKAMRIERDRRRNQEANDMDARVLAEARRRAELSPAEEDKALLKKIRSARKAPTDTPPPALPPTVEPPSGMTVSAAIKMLRHDPDYLGDIPTARLEDLLTVTNDPSVKKAHPRIRREIKSRKAAA